MIVRKRTLASSGKLAIVSTLDCTTFNFGCNLPVTYGQPVNYKVVATGKPTADSIGISAKLSENAQD